jgi:hypothetical protein
MSPGPPLIVSDLDGTLLNSQARLSPFAAGALNRLIAGGLAFTFATARSHQTAYPLMREVAVPLPVIVYNGVCLADFQTGRSHLTRFMDPTLARAVVDEGKTAGLAPIVYTDAGEHHAYHEAPANPGQAHYLAALAGDARLRPVRDVRDHLDEPVLGLNFIAPAGTLRPFAAAVRTRHGARLSFVLDADNYTPDYHWFHLADRQAGKGAMLAALAERTGHDLREAIVFGDSLTDLGMFAVAGQAVAVANARPEVKARAHTVIASNDEDAVVRFLLERFGA